MIASSRPEVVRAALAELKEVFEAVEKLDAAAHHDREIAGFVKDLEWPLMVWVRENFPSCQRLTSAGFTSGSSRS